MMIDELAPTTAYLTFYFQGEPYLNKDFLKMVRYSASKKIYTATSTNAHFLDDTKAEETVRSGLGRLIISIDGTDQEHYEAYRKEGSLQKVLDGTKNVIKWKKKLKSATPAILWQFLVVGPNEHQIPEIKKMAKDMGVDKLVLKTAQIYDYENGNELIPRQEKYSRYRLESDGKYSIKSTMLDHCWKMWSSCVVTWDGKIVPCCFDKDAHYILGDLSDSSFKNAWNSPEYDHFRSVLIESRSNMEMCQNCTEGTKVWA